MRSNIVKCLVLLGAILVIPASLAHAQEAVLSGTISDTTGGVLPGVVVRAMHLATGNSFETFTDERGSYRLPVRVGVYRLTAELQGFATVTREGLELLVGQTATINLQLAPSTLQESVTVTGEAPLIETSSSSLAGNIDPRQMQELPVNGRNWQDLLVLAPGNRLNAVSDAPSATNTFQLNIDGQQVTQLVDAGSGFGQPRYSRDAIAELELVTNQFDATQGRSTGVQVNAVTKSGTNTVAGTFSSFFRDDSMKAKDFVANRVLPYSDQQIAISGGGPIRRDRIHFFGNYEFEREPQTAIYNTPYPKFNVDLTGARRENKALVRFDTQFSPRTRWTLRGSAWRNNIPYSGSGSATTVPSSIQTFNRMTNQYYSQFTRVISNSAVNEVQGGYAGYNWVRHAQVRWMNNPQFATFGPYAAPGVQLRGFTMGNAGVIPQRVGQEVYSLKDNFTFSYELGGRHDVKTGGEYNYSHFFLYLCNSCAGQLDAQGGPIPANLEALFPDQFDASTWNLAPLSPISRRYTIGIGSFNEDAPRSYYAAWWQDDWKITPRLTLNLGLRYDLQHNVYANWAAVPPFLTANRPDDINDIAPRLGFAYTLDDKTVIRGGFGKFYGETTANAAAWLLRYTHQVVIQALYDGRSDFAINPFNGRAPTTYEEGLAYVKRTGAQTDAQNLSPQDTETFYSYQSSIGMQRQLGSTIAAQADYVWTGTRLDDLTRNINVTYNPATGVNYPFTDVSHKVYPQWGIVTMHLPEGWSNYHGIQTALTKRMSQNWQASATYTVSVFRDGTVSPAPFPVAKDLGGEYGFAVGDQRHRATFNGIWAMKYGFQLSGLYFYGSGARFATSYGGDLRALGAGGSARLRPDGSIVPRNAFVAKPLHRVDLRFQKRFAFAGNRGIDGIIEMFNAFNHANYGAFTTQESNPAYGKPAQNQDVAYQPRSVQLGVRVSF
jgi:hypothetical protein